VYSRYNWPQDTPALTEESFVYSDSNFKRKCLLCR
jgi:hypothetical protein